MLESLRREISTRPAPWRLYTVVTVGFLLTMVGLFEWGEHDEYWRVVHMVVISCIEIYLVGLTNRVRQRHQSKALWVVMVTFAAYAASNLSRTLEWWFTGRYSLLLDFTTIGNISLTINYLSAIFYCYGYWGFVVEKNRKRLVDVTEQAVIAREREKLAVEREHMAQEVLRERTDLMSRLAMVGKHAQSGALSASIAHELNQPLAAIQLNIEESQRMALNFQAPPPLQSLLERIKQDNQRSAVIVRRVREMFSQRPLRQERQVLDDLVLFATDWLKKRLERARIHIELELNAPHPFQFASGEMEHILMNLLDNALDALEQVPTGQGRITLRTWHKPGWVCLSVSDNGPGVPAHMKDSIFDLSATSKPDGMGLGLWLARYLVERHGGRLKLVQVATDGANFELSMPDQ